MAAFTRQTTSQGVQRVGSSLSLIRAHDLAGAGVTFEESNDACGSCGARHPQQNQHHCKAIGVQVKFIPSPRPSRSPQMPGTCSNSPPSPQGARRRERPASSDLVGERDLPAARAVEESTEGIVRAAAEQAISLQGLSSAQGARHSADGPASAPLP